MAELAAMNTPPFSKDTFSPQKNRVVFLPDELIFPACKLPISFQSLAGPKCKALQKKKQVLQNKS